MEADETQTITETQRITLDLVQMSEYIQLVWWTWTSSVLFYTLIGLFPVSVMLSADW